MGFNIKEIKAREVLDSRGNPTVEVTLKTDTVSVNAMVPSGASTGIHEAVELRDNDKKRFKGKGVLKAVKNVNDIIAPKLKNRDVREQEEIDQDLKEFDGTKNKAKLGANAILGVSMATAKAAAVELKTPLYAHIRSLADTRGLALPIPSLNVINGGVHAGNKLDIQEYMIMPFGAKNFTEAMRMAAEVYQTLKGILLKKYGKDAVNVGDEGGFAPPLKNAEEPIKLLLKAIKQAGYTEKQIKISLDSAASEFYKKGKYHLQGKQYTGEKLAAYYESLVKKYPIFSLEDPFAEDDFASFTLLNKAIGKKTQIVGDDLLVTNPERIDRAIKEKACNALLLKVNQIGTVTESIQAAKLAHRNAWNVMVSHRSGETEDSFIADFCVGIGASQIKSGAPCRSERLAKYNQLMRIEEVMGKDAKYYGKRFRV